MRLSTRTLLGRSTAAAAALLVIAAVGTVPASAAEEPAPATVTPAQLADVVTAASASTLTAQGIGWTKTVEDTTDADAWLQVAYDPQAHEMAAWTPAGDGVDGHVRGTIDVAGVGRYSPLDSSRYAAALRLLGKPGADMVFTAMNRPIPHLADEAPAGDVGFFWKMAKPTSGTVTATVETDGSTSYTWPMPSNTLITAGLNVMALPDAPDQLVFVKAWMSERIMGRTESLTDYYTYDTVHLDLPDPARVVTAAQLGKANAAVALPAELKRAADASARAAAKAAKAKHRKASVGDVRSATAKAAGSVRSARVSVTALRAGALLSARSPLNGALVRYSVTVSRGKVVVKALRPSDRVK